MEKIYTLKNVDKLLGYNAYLYAIQGAGNRPDYLDWDNENKCWYNEDNSKAFTDEDLEKLEIYEMFASGFLEITIVFKVG